MKFSAKVIPAGNATAVEIPEEVMEVLGPEGRPPVSVKINAHSWRTRVAVKSGRRLIGISAANREASGISEGDIVQVEIERDNESRAIVLPSDLSAALESVGQAAFERLPFGLRQRLVREIEQAKSPAVRQRRIQKLVKSLG
ncbi:YdeI/OmpD-associated family protein [Pelagibacterium lentulum]|uniref:DUF1905 domain-containing protein n=1 Tax=Pelagibacterium lentulum TaxID=2029865 RepID=A0A916W1U5_9HYPH|nr:YdeI/OmpD-associated family protein [Pelagibacterium lentulum]GGA59197.1 hypothetical protein GCM10011499_31650 [Pelagibacterium lentulum]